ncbi:MAG: sigma-70 family RNA polymerase sigma factor [Opitutales bacterium]
MAALPDKASTETLTDVVSARAQATASPSEVDFALVERVQQGDTSAFDTLVRKYRERLYSVIYNLTANHEDASDLTQEAFIKAFRSIGRFKGKSAFFTWLYRIGVNNTLSFLKKNRYRRFFSFDQLDEEGVPEEMLETLVARTGAERGTLLRELQEKLNEALQSLSMKHRTVVVLYEIEGLSHHQIATVLGCSEGTVRSRLHYAKNRLQAELEGYLG